MGSKLRSEKWAIVIINTICTLKCKHCITLTPYQQKKINFKIENIKKDIDIFFQIFGYVEHFDFEGGETLLHPDISDIIRHTLLHKDKFNRIHILTNATIIPSKELLEVCKGEEVRFIIGDYGPELSVKKPEVVNVLEEYGIKYRVDAYHGDNQYFNGWIDFGDFKFKNRSPDELFAHAKRCGQSLNIPRIKDGKVFKCVLQAAGINHIPLRGGVGGDYIDLHDASMTTNEKAELWKHINENPVATCNYCNGYMVDGLRVPAAEQFAPGELTDEMKFCP
jgi:hypothetical protein